MEEEKVIKDEGQKKGGRIDISKIISKGWENKKLFLKVWIITFVLSCVWILPKPRYYTTEVSLAPESNDMKAGGSFASLASNFGVSLGNSSSDAIYPQLYPDLFKSTEFLVELLDVHVTTIDGNVDTDYYTYLKNEQKQNLLLYPVNQLKNWIKSMVGDEEPSIPGKDGRRFDPFRLSKRDTEILGTVGGNIKCTYSKTTDVITINVTDQDPLVSAAMADSVMAHLQVFITDYRTKKSRIDYEHYKNLTDNARMAYEQSRREFAEYADSHQDVFMQSVKTKMESLENEMQLKFNVYTALNTRLEAAQAKVQENTPVFTTLKNATVPVKPAGPKRMIFVAAMLFLSTIGTFMFLFRKELKEWF